MLSGSWYLWALYSNLFPPPSNTHRHTHTSRSSTSPSSPTDLLSCQVSQLVSQLSPRLHLFHGITCSLPASLFYLASLLKFLGPDFCFLFLSPLPKSSYLLRQPCHGLSLPFFLCLGFLWFYYSGSCSMTPTSLQPPSNPLLIDGAVDCPGPGGLTLVLVEQQGALFRLHCYLLLILPGCV